MHLYSRDDLDRIPWPTGPDADYARRVLGPFMQQGTRPFIANVEAETRVLVAGDCVLPVIVVAGRTKGAYPSYVVSPTSHYIDYAKREVQLEMQDHPVLRRLFPPMLDLFRPILYLGRIEQAVYVNNWLLSTNLYPVLSPEVVRSLHELLCRTFPHHAIVFRSVNHDLNGAIAGHLGTLGYRAVFSRQVWLLDPSKGIHRKKTSYRRDRALAKRSPYEWVPGSALGPADCARLKRLYDDLYLDKYSRYNPQFTEAFFRETLASNWLEVMALRANGRLDGVLGFVQRQGVMTTPLIGYDRSLPDETGLYRLISLKLIQEAESRGLHLHQSSGAAAFKKHRGSEPSIEYSYVYDRHLPRFRRVPWQLLTAISRHVAVPLMRRLGL